LNDLTKQSLTSSITQIKFKKLPQSERYCDNHYRISPDVVTPKKSREVVCLLHAYHIVFSHIGPKSERANHSKEWDAKSLA
jgi:hypothetical protein